MSPVTKGIKQIVAEAEVEVVTLSRGDVETAVADGALLVDIRDVRELKREGKIPGAFHAPRGMLEFWVDPESSYHHEALSAADRLILYCNLGWRSALAAKALQDMGMTNVAHLDGGFDGWRSSGGSVEEPPPR